MLPKIVVGVRVLDEIYERLNLLKNKTLVLDVTDMKMEDYREDLNRKLLLKGADYALVIWNAHLLSPEMQGVLLKPLEEHKEGSFVLVSDSEERMLPTIISRCLVEKWSELETIDIWKEFMDAVKSYGLAITYVENMKDDSEKMEKVMVGVLGKLKESLITQVSEKRLELINLTHEYLPKMRVKGANRRLVFEDYMLQFARRMRD